MADLWVQQTARRGEVSYRKIDGASNTGDMMAKPVDCETMHRHLKAMGVEWIDGRAETAPMSKKFKTPRP